MPAEPAIADGVRREPRVLAIDAGGTMTDTFIVDRDGSFVVGKAQSTPADEAVGFMAPATDALAQWQLDPAQAFPRLVAGIYSGTAMLNRLLERKGRRIGLIVTGGMEDMLRLERGIQTYLGYPYSDRLHVATHHHNEPLVRASESTACASASTSSALRRCPSTRRRRAARCRRWWPPASKGSSSAFSSATAIPSTSSVCASLRASIIPSLRSSSPASCIRCGAICPA